MSQKRLLLCTAGLGSGGAEALLVRFVSAAIKEGWQIHVVSMSTENFHLPTLKAMGAEVSELPFGLNSGLYRRVAQAQRIADKFDPTIIQGWMYRGNFLASLIARKAHKKPFWGIFCTPLRSNSPRASQAFYWLQSKKSHKTEAIIYNGEKAHAQHVADGFSDHQSIVFVNGVDLDRYKPDLSLRKKIRTELSIPDDELLVLVAARVHPQKDWPTILEATRKSPRITVMAAGANTDQLSPIPNLKRLGVRMDMAALYNAADLFSLPSAFAEGTSVAMSEALACGTPGIVTNIGDNAKVIRNAGVVVPIGDPGGLAEAWRELDENREKLRALKANARTVAEEQFDDRKTFRPILMAYDKTIANTNGSA